MDKRYQVFVSSTFTDLKEERSSVIQTLMKMDCIAAGMELFPALDEEQFQFIRRVIDDCDYYLLIIGGRYGSVTEEGISYTEKEYDYAVEKSIKVLALIHGAPDKIPVGKSEETTTARKKLGAFREKVMRGRLVDFWTKPEELPGKVALSITLTIKNYPATGWVRASHLDQTNELLHELNEARKQNELLRHELELLKSQKTGLQVIDHSTIKDSFVVKGYYVLPGSSNSSQNRQTWIYEFSWESIFKIMGPYLLVNPSEASLRSSLPGILFKVTRIEGSPVGLDSGDLFDILKLQFMAYGLIEIDIDPNTKSSIWKLTEQGKRMMLTLNALHITKYTPT